MITNYFQASSRDINLSKKSVSNEKFLNARFPAVIYGKSLKKSFPIFLEAPKKGKLDIDFGSMISLKWSGKNLKATVKEMQRDPISREVLHVSLQAVKSNEVINSEIPLNFIGTAKGDSSGGILFTQKERVQVSGRADMMPDAIDVDISNLDIDESILVRDLKLPKGVELHESEDDQPIILCRPPKREEALESELEVSGENQTEVINQLTDQDE